VPSFSGGASGELPSTQLALAAIKHASELAAAKSEVAALRELLTTADATAYAAAASAAADAAGKVARAVIDDGGREVSDAAAALKLKAAHLRLDDEAAAAATSDRIEPGWRLMGTFLDRNH
jgi:hypothetical protein